MILDKVQNSFLNVLQFRATKPRFENSSRAGCRARGIDAINFPILLRTDSSHRHTHARVVTFTYILNDSWSFASLVKVTTEQLVSDPFNSYVILAALYTRRTEGLNFHAKRLFYKRYLAWTEQIERGIGRRTGIRLLYSLNTKQCSNLSFTREMFVLSFCKETFVANTSCYGYIKYILDNTGIDGECNVW